MDSLIGGYKQRLAVALRRLQDAEVLILGHVISRLDAVSGRLAT